MHEGLTRRELAQKVREECRRLGLGDYPYGLVDSPAEAFAFLCWLDTFEQFRFSVESPAESGERWNAYLYHWVRGDDGTRSLYGYVGGDHDFCLAACQVFLNFAATRP